MASYLRSPAAGQESQQMWGLNKRLEAYLCRVKALEEENELLRGEIESLKGSRAERSWRSQFEDEVSALRDELDASFRDKYEVELERDSLADEVELVKRRCQREREAQEDAKKELAENKKALEEERRAQIWLKEKAAQLESELEALAEAHEADRAELEQEVASLSQGMDSFRVAPVALAPLELEDYSQRLSEVWRGAVESYKSQASSLEATLAESKDRLWKATEESRQSQAQLQALEKELAGLKMRKELLEQRLAREWQDQRGDLEQCQLDIESLEKEKQGLRVQIAHVLEDRQQLMHLKMSLSLEVATYRTLLEAESTRLLMPFTDSKQASPFRDSKSDYSSSPFLEMTPDVRKYATRDSRYSSPVLHGENKAFLPKNQSSFLNVKKTTLSKSPHSISVEVPRTNLVQSQNLSYTNGAGPAKLTTESKLRNNKPSEDIKVETLSKSISSGLSKSIERPSEELKSDISVHTNIVSDSHIKRKEQDNEKIHDKKESEEIVREELHRKQTDNDFIAEEHHRNEEPTIPELDFTHELLTETLEATEEKIEVTDIDAGKIYVNKTEPSLLKGMGVTFDIPSVDSHPLESDSHGPPHMDTRIKEEEKEETSEPCEEVENKAQIYLSSEQALYLEEATDDKDTVKQNDVTSTLLIGTEDDLDELRLEGEIQASDIPSAVKIPCVEEETREEALLQTPTQENSEDINVTIQKNLFDEPTHKAEEFDSLGPDTMATETRILQMTEEENLQDLASAAEDTEDYDVVSDVQESMFFKTESLSTEDAELTEIIPSDTQGQVADQLMLEHGEREEDMLTDTEDLTEDQENDEGMDMVTEYEILSVRVNENLGLRENVAQIENTDMGEFGTEEEVNRDSEHGMWKHETLTATENAMQEENVNARVSDLEKETEVVIKSTFEQDNISPEDLEVKESISFLPAMGVEQEDEVISQRGPYPDESDFTSKIESNEDHCKTETLNEDISEEPTWSNDIASTEKKESSPELESKLESDLSDLTTNTEVDIKIQNPNEQSPLGQDMEFENALFQKDASDELLDANELQLEDRNLLCKETSYSETGEDDYGAIAEPFDEQITEIPSGSELLETAEEQVRLESWEKSPGVYQTQSEYTSSGDYIDTQHGISQKIFDSETSDVYKLGVENKECLLEDTIEDTTPLPTYDEDTEGLDLETQESLETLTHVEKETEFLNVDQAMDLSEQDMDFNKDLVQKVVPEHTSGTGEEQNEEANIFATESEEISNHSFFEDETRVYPDPHEVGGPGVEQQESDEEQEMLERFNSEPEAYHMQTQYSENSVDSQNVFLQDLSQNETCNVDTNKIENDKLYGLEEPFPDTTPVPNQVDETRILNLDVQDSPEVLSHIHKEGDACHDEETSIKCVPSENELSFSLTGTPQSEEANLNQTTTETENDTQKVDILLEKSLESLEASVLTISNQQVIDSEDKGLIDDFQQSALSAQVRNDQEILDECEPTEITTYKTATPTNADTMLKQVEEHFEEVTEESLTCAKEAMEESEAILVSEMEELHQEKFEYGEAKTQVLESGLAVTASKQSEEYFEDLADELPEHLVEEYDKSETLTTQDMNKVDQQAFECEERMEQDSPSHTGTISNQDVAIESNEEDEDISEESESLNKVNLTEVQDSLYSEETEHEKLTSEISLNADTLLESSKGNAEGVVIESLENAKEVNEGCYAVIDNEMEATDQETFKSSETETEEFGSEMITSTVAMSKQEEESLDDIAVASENAIVESVEQRKYQEKFESDDRDDTEPLTQTPINEFTPSEKDDHQLENVDLESHEHVEQVIKEVTQAQLDEEINKAINENEFEPHEHINKVIEESKVESHDHVEHVIKESEDGPREHINQVFKDNEDEYIEQVIEGSEQVLNDAIQQITKESKEESGEHDQQFNEGRGFESHKHVEQLIEGNELEHVQQVTNKSEDESHKNEQQVIEGSEDELQEHVHKVIEKSEQGSLEHTQQITNESEAVSQEDGKQVIEGSEFESHERIEQVIEASEMRDIYKQRFDYEDAEFIPKSEENTILSSDSLYVLEGVTGSEHGLSSASSVATVDSKDISTCFSEEIRSLEDDQPLGFSQNPEIRSIESDDSVSSDEESPNVTKAAYGSEDEVLSSCGSEIERVACETNESLAVHALTDSLEYGFGEDSVPVKESEQVISTQEEIQYVADISDLPKNVEHPSQAEDWSSETHTGTSEQSIGSADVLSDEPMRDQFKELFPINPEHFLLNPLRFTEKSPFLEESSDDPNGLFSVTDINDLPEIKREMQNGHSSIDECQDVDFINQDSEENIESGIQIQPDSDSLEQNKLIQESDEKEFSFSKAAMSQSLFQQLLGPSNEKENARLKEEHMMSSEEGPTPVEDRNGNANSAKEKNMDDFFQTISNTLSFEDGQLHIAADQQQKDTFEKISDAKGLKHNVEAWSSDDD
ncbi:nestin [Lissotriton helveticus]